ncbi:hypothetical protein FA13DRAFT_1725067 [Coprinellus micaceus]|uniref:Uncharacterized protein n=1 Tax=Coprinellus micaceus TaxID=71717 RepID=A0A4Y7TZY2_COPMI|nr:hypothetical protein FA13DRAFT_1725067 [Coprinellus micaceus]
MLQAFHDRTSRAPSMLPLTNQTISRRHGWGESDSPLSTWGQTDLSRLTARLDADGNEVPPDEEEDFLERNRTELRVRRARDALAGPLLFDPDGASQPGPQAFGGSLERTVEGLAVRGPVDLSEAPRRRRTTGDLIGKPDVRRRRLDPLPMALDGMVASSKRARYLDDDPVVVVGRWASFAGR